MFRIFSFLGWPRAQWGWLSPESSQIIADTWKRPHPKTWGIFWFILSVALAFQPNSLSANPTGETIVHGSADVVRDDPAHLTINQHTDKAIIDWIGFSIGAAESVTFSQPSSSSLAVNRVVGNESSSILGQLTANGRLMLINPNGILFGAGSRVDVNSLIATTIDISNERILANDFTFDQMSNPAATIVNRGTITAAEGGLVALVAPGVENTGVIQARLGTVSLASGQEFTLDLYGDGLVKLPVDAQTSQQLFAPDGTPLEGLVNNSGTIQADGGTVLLTAQTATNILDRVINMDGIVQANSVAEVNGQIVLSGGDLGVVEVAGTLEASGDDADETGGTIKVLGEKVGLFGNARVDASGDAGGGEVLIGGNFQGKGPEQNAKKTYIGEEAKIDAHAKTAGDGGRVIVWADEMTRYYGDIDARGGYTSGNGGFAEVSGKLNLDFQGTADLTAANGDLGTLLLDPLNVFVITGGLAAAADVDAFTDNPGASLNIAPATLDAVAGNVTLQATNDIIFFNDLTLSTAGATFTAQARNNITLNANVDIATNAAAITLSADDDASGAGTISLAAGATVTSGGANISMKAFDMTIDGTASVNSGAGSTTLLAAVGGTDVGGASANLNLSTAELDRITAGVLKIGDATSGAITISSDITPANTTTLHLQSGSTITGTAGGIVETNLAISAGGTVNFTDTTTDVDNLAVSAAGQTVTFVDTDDLDIDTVNSVVGATAGTLNLSTGGALTDAQAITATNLSITNTAADTTLDVATTDVDNLAVSAAGRTVSFRDVDDLDIDTVNGIVGATATTLNLTTGGALTDAQAITATNLSITNTAADTTLDVATTDVDNLAVSAAGRTVSFRDVDDLDIDTVNGVVGATATTLNLTTGGALTDAQAITATNLSITNTAADTTLDVATTDVDNLAVSAAGRTVSFRDVDDLDIDTVNGIVGATATTLNLTTGGALTDAQAVIATNLSVSGGGAVTLDTATNDVDTLAIATSTGNVTFTDSDGFTVGTVNGVTGVDTNAGAVAMTATTGTLTVSNTAAANDVEATGNITLTAAANEATVDVQAGADVESSAGNISIISDIISLPGTLTASAGANQSVTLAPETAHDAEVIDVGTDGTIANRFEITNTVIDQITTDTVVIGSSASGALTVSADITAANATGLDLRSGSTVTASAGGIIEDSLAVTAGGAVTFSDAQQNVATLAINAAGQTVNYTETTGYALGLVNGINGATASTLNLMSGGALTGALTATALQISGTSAVLTGTLNGLANQSAASAVTLVGAVGVGPYTLNGFSIFGSSASAQTSASTSAQNRAVTIPPAIINTQVHQTLLGAVSSPTTSSSLNRGSGSDTPYEALLQDLLTEHVEPNVYQNNFQLLALSENTKIAFNKELNYLGNFWSPPEDEDMWLPGSFPVLGQEDEQKPNNFQAVQDREP